MRSFIPTALLGAVLSAHPVLAAGADPALFQASPLTQSLATAKARAATPPVEAPPATAPPRRAEPLAAAAPATQVRHLPNNSQGYRLAGEMGATEWPVFFTQAQAAGPIRFQLGYLSAVSVMPEASRLIVQVNDVTIAVTPVRAPHGVRVLTFDVPQDLVKPGFNSLRVLVQQRHRVDCSLRATYELWTQIDPSQTGFVFAANDPGGASVDEIAALPPSPQGALPVRAMLPPAASVTMIQRMLRAVQTLAISGRFEQPLVEVESGAAMDGHGVNVAVGTFDELRLMPGLEDLRRPEAPVLRVLPARGGRATLVISGRDDREVEEALAALSNVTGLTGAEPGVRAARAFPGLRLNGGESATLRDFGMVTQEFSGRMYRASFQVTLPSDFYPSDYGKVQLILAGGYSAGLSTDAQVVVNINGRNVIGVPLPKSHGEFFKERPIELPLGAMRPGLNKIEIEAHLPTAEDQSCDPLQMIEQKQRFLLMDSTRLVLPNIARIARMPNLSVTATGAFPYRAYPSILYVPKPDRETLAAAATLAARLAVSAGHAMDLRLTTTAPQPGAEATIAIGTASALGADAFAAAGLSDTLLGEAWKSWADDVAPRGLNARLSRFEALARANHALQRNFPPACRVRAPSSRVREALHSAQSATAEPSGLSGQWLKKQRESNVVWNAATGAYEMVRGASVWLAGFVRPHVAAEDPAAIVTPASSLVMAQGNHGRSGVGVWTLVAAPSPAVLMEAMACMVDPRVWMQLDGRVAALDSNEAKISSIAASSMEFVPTQPLSVQNTRLIVAGWFSLNRWSYVVVMLLAALALGASTFWLVRNIGRREQ